MSTEQEGVSRRGVLSGAAGGGLLAAGGVGLSGATRAGDGAPDVNPDGEVEVVVQLHGEVAPAIGDLDRSRAVDRLEEQAAVARERFAARVADRDGVDVERGFWLANAVLVAVDTGAVGLDELAELDVVAGLERNRRVDPPPIPDDPDGAVDGESSTGRPTDARRALGPAASLGDGAPEVTWGLEMLGAPVAWDFYGTRGEGVDVGVIGTGVDPAGHDGIRESLERGGWAEFDEAGERVDTDPRDPQGHGTGVSGAIVGGTTDEGVAYGIAPGANLYHARRARSFASTLAAFDWAAENGVDVLSLSWGPLTYNPIFARGVERARAAGMVVVGSVGNAGRYTSANPGNLPTTVGVGVVDRDRAVPEWSGGERIATERYWGGGAGEDWPEQYTVPDVVGPGVDLPLAEVGGGFRRTGGASYSTPLVAGAVALVLAAGASDPAAAERHLLETARHPDLDDAFAVAPERDDRHGLGVANALHAATRANATESVSGRVTEPDGDPVAGADVVSETGMATTTGRDGRYTLSVPPGEQPIGATALGYDLAFDIFDPAERDRFDLTLEPTDAPAASLRDGLPTRVGPGGTMTATFEVVNARTVSVTTDVTGPLSEDDLSLSVDGRAAQFGDGVTFDEPKDADALELAVEVDDGALPGRLDLPVYVGGDGDPVEGVLEGVHVHPDPLRIDPQVPSVGAALDLVAPGTVVTMESGTYEEPAAEDGPGALVVDKPVTLAAAEGESPEFVPKAEGTPAAVFVSANDVKLAELAVDANGADAAVRAGLGSGNRKPVAPSGLAVRGNELAGARDGVVTERAPAAWVEDNRVAAGRTGVDVRDKQGTAVRRNVIDGGRTGVRVGGVATEVTGNRIRGVSGVGVLVETPALFGRFVGPIADNEIDGVETGILVRGRARGGVEDNRISNVDGTAIVVTGSLLGPIRGNRVDGAAVGLDLRKGSVEGEIAGNEFRDVETVRAGEGEPPPGTATATGTAGPNASATPADGRPPAESSLDVLLYGATALAFGSLLVPYGLRRYWRR